MKTPPIQLDHLHVSGLESGSTQSEKVGGFPLPPSRFHHKVNMCVCAAWVCGSTYDYTCAHCVGFHVCVCVCVCVSWNPSHTHNGVLRLPKCLNVFVLVLF